MMGTEQKWITENGVFYPISGDTVLHTTPGPGVFQFYKNPDPHDGRVGLKKIGDKFEFDFKIYDLGNDKLLDRIEKTWNSDYFVNKGNNLGVIFNGIKGTGKTIAAKILCNKMEMPVVIIPYCIPELQDFLQSLEFECIILIDEAEKTFKSNEMSNVNSDEILLKLIDGVYNKARKLYILTTNKLSINENLLGRPGRIRYIQQFGNLTEKAIFEYLEDNLIDKTKKDEITSSIDLLQISTIDILRAMVDEVNMHGDLNIGNSLNIPKANYGFEILCFRELDRNNLDELRELILPVIKSGKLDDWLATRDSNGNSNEDMLNSKYGYRWIRKITSQFSVLWKGSKTNIGDVIEEPDKDGFFEIADTGGVMGGLITDMQNYTCILIKGLSIPSLYRGGLAHD